MKFPLSWLKEHLQTDCDASAISEALTGLGLEVESVEDKGAQLSAFTVARVISAEQHPNADRLRVCKVDTGKETVQVVCGAPNAREGIKVVFAPPGTYVPGSDFTLSAAKIRGVESFGMMCSERELLLSEEHNGIIELSGDPEVGSPAALALGLTDPIIDVSITPNRGDCVSVHGLARDLAAAGIGTLKTGTVAPVKGNFPSPITTALDFAGADASPCPIFAGRLIRGVKNGPSPDWVQKKLKAVGLRPISALVDVTNLIAHAYGRPLHVFDAAKLKGNVRARFAKDDETLRALDGRDYTLGPDMVVIADDEKALGIAGIIGGEDSGCTETTTDVFIESALFAPAAIARAGRKLGIISDARYRFERGVDPAFVLPGLELATKLIVELCGGEPSDTVVAGAAPLARESITFDPALVHKRAGLDVPADAVSHILTRLGFQVEPHAALKVTPPSWRHDVSGPADLVEEVVRIRGIDSVPSTPLPRPNAVARAVLTPAQRRRETMRRSLAVRGFDETVSFSFLPRAHAKLFGGGDDARQLQNPISADLDALRPSLMPSLLAAAGRNRARGFTTLSFFEIGPQFSGGAPGEQALVAAAIRVGNPARHWRKNANVADLFSIKADCLHALDSAWGSNPSLPVTADAASWYHPGRSGALRLGPKLLAMFGEIHPAVISAFDLAGPVSGFEIFLEAIPEAKARDGKAKPALELSDLPAVERDFAFVVERGVNAEQILKAARGVDRQIITGAEIFDLYEGKGVPDGKKSVGIFVRLQPKEKTFTDAEIEALSQKIIAAVTKATGATLRS